MHVADADRVEVIVHKLKDIARVWYDQWKNSKGEGALIVS